jgi:hypothetical protein
MGVRNMDLVWERSTTRGLERNVLTFLAYCADSSGRCRRRATTVATIAKATRMSERLVLRSLQRLADAGEIEIPAGVPSRKNPYRVVLEAREER